MDFDYRNKLYGGFAGKYIGVMHGAEIESWTCEKIKDVYGTITGYPVTFRNFCSDDDLNGPVFYMRALKDFACREDIPVESMAHTLLNYAGERHGFFWWGGYGISTEETAYWNLRNHIPAPESGSVFTEWTGTGRTNRRTDFFRLLGAGLSGKSVYGSQAGR